MKTEVLQAVLTEILKENKQVQEEQQMLIKAMEKQAEELAKIHSHNSETDIYQILEKAFGHININLKDFHNGLIEKMEQHSEANQKLLQFALDEINKLIIPLRKIMLISVGAALLAFIFLLIILLIF